MSIIDLMLWSERQELRRKQEELHKELDAAFESYKSELYEKIAKDVIEGTLSRFTPPCAVQLSLYVVGEEEIREANRECRGIDKVTDVLSFPNLPFDPEHIAEYDLAEDAGCYDPESGELILGEIMICAAKLYAQAEEYGHSAEREFAFLTAHSMLHLLGYDHETEEDRAVMEALQDEILTEAGYER